MPKKDTYHEHVKEAVQKDNWDVTDDPLSLSRGNVDLSVDLGAEKIITAEKGLEKIAIEIKSFRRSSLVNAFHEAVGQYRNYRRVLKKNKSERILYLAVPEKTYKIFQEEIFYMEGIEEDKINLLVFNVAKREVVSWIKH